MARVRSAKQLGSRHDRNYFRQWTSGRKWRAGLSISLPLVAVVWLVGHALSGNAVPYSSGPMSPPHAIFGRNCEACHAVKKNIFGSESFQKRVTDDACQGCHEAPLHHANAIETPRCSACHVEHKGADLIRVADTSCADCHGQLKTKTGELKFAAKVKSFTGDHPEFTAVERRRDPGGIKLNHDVHLRTDLKGPNGSTVQLQCSDCHRPVADMEGAWRFSEAPTSNPANGSQLELSEPGERVDPAKGRSYMAPVKFAKQCAACHELHFDPRMNEAVPHGKKPEEIHTFLQTSYKEYLATHPGAWRESPSRMWLIAGQRELRIARSPEEWLEIQTEQAEMLLWRKTCKLCHSLEFEENKPLPEVKAAKLTVRWLPHAGFSHYAHQAVACDSCHSGVRQSKETFDVLIPGIATCRACHSGKESQVGQSESGCFLCHQYHEWKSRKPGLKGTFTIEQLLAKKVR